MNKLIKCLLFFIVLIFSINQNLNALLLDPGTGETTAYTLITSDYGPRNVDTGSTFHKGIDYNIRYGGKGYAIEGGEFTKFLKPTTNYASLVIGQWEYMHIETTKYGDTFQVLKKGYKDKDNDTKLPDNVIIFRENKDKVLYAINHIIS